MNPKARIDSLRAEIKKKEKVLEDTKAYYIELVNSKSWKYTQPLREFIDRLKK